MDSLAREQEVLDNHDEEISAISLRIQQMIKQCSPTSEAGVRKMMSCSLNNLQERLALVEASSATLSGAPEHVHVLHQYDEQLSDLKMELRTIRQNVIMAGVEGTDELFTTIATLDRRLFEASLNVKNTSIPTRSTHLLKYRHMPPLDLMV